MDKHVNAATAAEIISQYTGIPLHQLVDIMAEVPSEDVEPVRRGQWVFSDYYTKCSVCGEAAIYDEFKDECETNYCPNCGAKMEGESNV